MLTQTIVSKALKKKSKYEGKGKAIAGHKLWQIQNIKTNSLFLDINVETIFLHPKVKCCLIA